MRCLAVAALTARAVRWDEARVPGGMLALVPVVTPDLMPDFIPGFIPLMGVEFTTFVRWNSPFGAEVSM